MDINQFRAAMKEKGIVDEEIDEAVAKEKKRIHLLAFGLDNKKVNVVASINNTIVFVDSKFPGKVEINDVWICTVERNGNVYYAMPMYKVSASFLMNLDSDLRDEIINLLWRRNKKLFEKDFEELYKDEIHDSAIEEARSELDGYIKELKDKVSELEYKLEQNRILNRSFTTTQASGGEMIELSSDVEEECIELCSDVPKTHPDAQVPQTMSPPKIPNYYSSSAPGIPEIRVPERRDDLPHAVFIVERTGEETLFSESFTDHRYFVHISPDAKVLVIRPNEYGSAICINRSLRLMGLGKVSQFTEPRKLTAEYSARYEGLMIYL